MARKEKVYEVHDDEGALRSFFTLEEANKFAQDRGLTLVVRIVEHPTPPKIDLSNCEPAPF